MNLEDRIQQELASVAQPFLQKLYFLQDRIQKSDEQHKGHLNELLTKLRQQSFEACYNYFKNKIDNRIETPVIDATNEDDSIRELSNIVGLYFKICEASEAETTS
jgi:hypothetical protein